MRTFSKYFTWFLFGLAILGGIGTLLGFFTGGDTKTEETLTEVNESSTEEAFASYFAKEWLTIKAGETAQERMAKITPYLTVNEMDWEVPTVSQVPKQISVQNVERYEEDKETIVTLDVVVGIERDNTVGSSDMDEENEESETESEDTGVDENINEKRFYLQVPVIAVENGLAIRSEPVMAPAVDVKKYTYQPKETVASGDIVVESEQFIRNFAESYFKGVSPVDIQPYLASKVDVKPLGDFEDLVSVDQVTIYDRGQDKEKEPTEKYYFAQVYMTVQDPTTRILYTQKMRVYFTKELTGEEKLKITYVLRN